MISQRLNPTESRLFLVRSNPAAAPEPTTGQQFWHAVGFVGLIVTDIAALWLAWWIIRLTWRHLALVFVLVISIAAAHAQRPLALAPPPAPAPPPSFTLPDYSMALETLAGRALDFTSTEECLRRAWCKEKELPQGLVHNKPAFA